MLWESRLPRQKPPPWKHIRQGSVPDGGPVRPCTSGSESACRVRLICVVLGLHPPEVVVADHDCASPRVARALHRLRPRCPAQRAPSRKLRRSGSTGGRSSLWSAVRYPAKATSGLLCGSPFGRCAASAPQNALVQAAHYTPRPSITRHCDILWCNAYRMVCRVPSTDPGHQTDGSVCPIPAAPRRVESRGYANHI